MYRLRRGAARRMITIIKCANVHHVLSLCGIDWQSESCMQQADGTGQECAAQRTMITARTQQHGKS